jgi:hypothetical protein
MQHVKYPYSVRRLIKKKSTAWFVDRTFRTKELPTSYKKVAFKCKTAIINVTTAYENHLVSGQNLGAFYCCTNKRFSFKSAVGPLQDENGLVTDNLERKVSLLQRAFVTCHTSTNGSQPSDVKKVSSQFNHVYFSSSLVRRAIKRLQTKTKGGRDGIPPIFFINCCDELSYYPHSLFFTYSFDNSILPHV